MKEQCDCTSVCGDDQRIWRGQVSMCQDRYQSVHYMCYPKPDWKYQLDVAEKIIARLQAGGDSPKSNKENAGCHSCRYYLAHRVECLHEFHRGQHMRDGLIGKCDLFKPPG